MKTICIFQASYFIEQNAEGWGDWEKSSFFQIDVLC